MQLHLPDFFIPSFYLPYGVIIIGIKSSSSSRRNKVYKQHLMASLTSPAQHSSPKRNSSHGFIPPTNEFRAKYYFILINQSRFKKWYKILMDF